MPMKIYLAAGIHQDPLCRPALTRYLNRLIGTLGGPPKLVAVEMDEGIKWDLKLRRAALNRFLGGLWNEGVHDELRRILADTLAWEVDGHREALDDFAPLFLDRDGRRAAAANAPLFFNLIIQACDGYPANRQSTQQVLEYMSLKLADEADKTWQATYDEKQEEQAERQKGWMEVLKPELDKEGWGLAVVGALHATTYDKPNMFRWLLDLSGCLGGVEYLTWQPPPAIR